MMALLALVILGGFFFSTLGVENRAVLLFWVDFWVGLGLVSALVANVWDFISPLSNLGRGLDSRLARRGIPSRLYPDELGVWPAVALLLAFSWAELVWRGSRRGFVRLTSAPAVPLVSGGLVERPGEGAGGRARPVRALRETEQEEEESLR